MARLSWGRRPRTDPRDPPRLRVVLAVLIALSVVLAGVDGFVHRSIIGADTPRRIQELLDQHLATLETRNDFHYFRTLDRQSEAHTRCMSEHFARGGERVAELRPNRLIRAEETSPDSALVRAYVQRRDGVAVEYIRRAQIINILTLPPFDIRDVASVWYLSSPTPAELADQVITAAGGGTLESRGIDRGAREAVERELEALYLELASPPIEAPGAPQMPPLRVRLLPAPEHAPAGCVNGAVYDRTREEVLLHPHWADAERSSLSARSRESLRQALRERHP